MRGHATHPQKWMPATGAKGGEGVPGKRSYNCSQCGKACVSPSKLATHERTHTGEKLFPCDICPMQFTALQPPHCPHAGRIIIEYTKPNEPASEQFHT